MSNIKANPWRGFLRDRRDVVFAGGSPSAQLLVEEAAEDVTALAHGPAHSLQQQEPAGRKPTHSNTDPKASTRARPPPPPHARSLEVEVDDDVVEELAGVQTGQVFLGDGDPASVRRGRVLD